MAIEVEACLCNWCEVYERGNVVLDWVTVILIIWQTDFHD